MTDGGACPDCLSKNCDGKCPMNQGATRRQTVQYVNITIDKNRQYCGSEIPDFELRYKILHLHLAFFYYFRVQLRIRCYQIPN